MTGMRDFAILFVDLIVTWARLARPGGLRSVVAESVLVRHQLVILNRGRKRSPNLRAADYRRLMHPVHALGACPAFRHRSEAFHSVASPEYVAPTKVPHLVFARTPAAPRPERSQ